MDKNSYFSTANSGNGFVNYNDKIYGDLDYLYIIKGGPGTGKSSFLKKLNKEAKSKNYETECFLCSSDPNSFDGLIIDGKIGIIGGTNPHAFDMLKPGLRDNIINLGMFWNTKLLKINENEIEVLNKEKSKLYNKLYLLLNTALNIEKIELKTAEKYFDYEKAEKKISAFITKLGKQNTPYVEKIRLTNAISSKGETSLSSFIDVDTRIILLQDYYMFGAIYIEIFRKKTKRKEYFSHSKL